MSNPYTKLCRDLKRKCVDYAADYLMEDFLVSNAGKLFTKKHKNKKGVIVGGKKDVDNDWVASMDNFILFDKIMNDERVLDVISKKEKGFSPEEKEILADWQKKAFNSIFEIIDIDENNLKLFDVVAEVNYEVYSNNEESLSKLFSDVEKRSFMQTNIVPVKNFWFLSGNQQILPVTVEKNIFEDFIQRQPSKNIYRNNPEKLKKAFKLQKEIYDFFVEYYGTDEVIGTGKALEQKQWEFYNAWNARLGGKNYIPKEVFSEEFKESNSAGMIMNSKNGEYFFIDYGRFIEIFAEPDKRQKGRKKLVLEYLKDESIPRFVFERVKDRYQDDFRKIIKELIGFKFKKDFDPVNDFNMLMEKYKPTEDDPYPSIQPLNERFKKYYYQNQNKIGRNDSCFCGSGKKFKKCCGR